MESIFLDLAVAFFVKFWMSLGEIMFFNSLNGKCQINTRSTVKLDSHAKKEAEKIINEILDDEYEGKWKPSDVGKSAKKTKKKVKNDN